MVFFVCFLLPGCPDATPLKSCCRHRQLEAWGVKAHLVRTLNEADAILETLRKTAITNARASYMNIGWGNHMGSPSAKEKQAMLDEIDNQLRDLNVTPAERKALTATYVKLIGFDLYMLYVRTLERYFQFKEGAMVSEVSKNNSGPTKAELDRWRAGRPGTSGNAPALIEVSERTSGYRPT